MSKKNNAKKLITDKKTDYLFDYFINEDKFNEQMKGDWDEEMEKKIKNREPNLDSRIATDKHPTRSDSSQEEKELPSSSIRSAGNMDVEFNDEDSERSSKSSYSSDSRSSVSSSRRSPFGQRINAVPYASMPVQQVQQQFLPNNGQFVEVVETKYVETAEERRARARENYCKLQDLVEKYNVVLTRNFTINDDPDEMQEEYDMHKNKRNKNNQVKFYKQILLNVVSGAEFMNDRYNPFEFKLKDWSKQVASDLDDYTEVLEEIYEKYKHVGGKMAPEIKLVFMIIMSGVTYHISQSLFGNGGLDATIQSNPNIVNKLFGGLMKGGLGGLGGNAEPVESKVPDNRNILNVIKKHNQNKNVRSDTLRSDTTTNSATTATNIESDTDSKLAATTEKLKLERERRLLAEQKADFEAQKRRENEIMSARMDQLQNQQNNFIQSQILSAQRPKEEIVINLGPANEEIVESGPNQVLSDGRTGPRYQKNKLLNLSSNLSSGSDRTDDMFDSEIKNIPSKPKNSSVRPSYQASVKNSSVKKPKKDFDELIETLEESTDIDLDEIINSSKKKNSKINSSVKKPKLISVTKSASRSSSKKGNASDGTSSTKRNNIVRL